MQGDSWRRVMLERLMQEEKNPNMGPRSFSTVYLITVQISTFSTQNLVSILVAHEFVTIAHIAAPAYCI